MSKALAPHLANLGISIPKVLQAKGRLGYHHELLLIVLDGAELAGSWPTHTGIELWY